MKTLRSTVGMPVVCKGRRIGRLLQAELSEDLTQLNGIWVSSGIGFTRWIPADELQLLGQVAVFCDGPGMRSHSPCAPLFRRATSTDGARLGAITGAEIDEVSFTVTALELSQGFWDDLIYGRQVVRAFTVDRATGEVIVGPSGQGKEAIIDEEQHGQGAADGRDDRLGSGDSVWRHELANRTQMEPKGQNDRKLDL